jgi:hypothetical protein
MVTFGCAKKALYLLSMKRHLSSFAFLFWIVGAVFVSCSKPKAKDIVVSELKTACAHVDALHIVADEIIALLGSEAETGIKDPSKLMPLLRLTSKMDEINESAEQFSREEAASCSGWEELQEKSKKIGG